MTHYTIVYHPVLHLSPDYFAEETHDYEELHFTDDAEALKTGLTMDRKRMGSVYFQKRDGDQVLMQDRLRWNDNDKILVSPEEAFAVIVRKLHQVHGVTHGASLEDAPSHSRYSDYKFRVLMNRLLESIEDVPCRAEHVQDAFTTIRKMKTETLDEPWLNSEQRERVFRECKLAEQYLDSLGVR